ncbi:MAG: hypothetical protein RIA63_03220, partial [Cyclobacteriaceae bacterium]
ENIFIYDETKKRYFRNNILSQSSNCLIDSVSKTISTFGQGGMASMIYNSETYTWEENKLKLIKSIQQDYNDKLNRFIRETKTLSDLTWTTQVDTLTEAQLLDMRDGN